LEIQIKKGPNIKDLSASYFRVRLLMSVHSILAQRERNVTEKTQSKKTHVLFHHFDVSA